MKIKEEVTLREVENDLNEGKDFYDQIETGWHKKLAWFCLKYKENLVPQK